jgi:hypothetical protein
VASTTTFCGSSITIRQLSEAMAAMDGVEATVASTPSGSPSITT